MSMKLIITAVIAVIMVIGMAGAAGYTHGIISRSVHTINSGALSTLQASDGYDVLNLYFINPDFNLTNPHLPTNIAAAIIALKAVVAEEAAREGAYDVAIPVNVSLIKVDTPIYTYHTDDILTETVESVQAKITNDLA